MSLTLFALIASAIMTLAVVAIVAVVHYLRRGQPARQRPPERWPLRVIYCVVAPILAFCIVSALIVLFVAGPCGLAFGFAEGTMLLAFGGDLMPLTAAAIAFALAINHGRRVVLTESIAAVLCVMVLVAYELSPYQAAPVTYDSNNRCQMQGP
jgi:O-antigen ligase